MLYLDLNMYLVPVLFSVLTGFSQNCTSDLFLAEQMDELLLEHFGKRLSGIMREREREVEIISGCCVKATMQHHQILLNPDRNTKLCMTGARLL